MNDWGKKLEDLIDTERTLEEAEEHSKQEFRAFIDSTGRTTLNEIISVFRKKGIDGEIKVQLDELKALITLENGFEFAIERKKAYLKTPFSNKDLEPLNDYTKKALIKSVTSAYDLFIKIKAEQ